MRGMRRLKMQELLTNGSRNIAKRVICSPSKLPLILTNRNKYYNIFSSCFESELNEVSEKSPHCKPRYGRQNTLFPKCSALNYLPIATKLTSLVGTPWNMGCISSRKIPGTGAKKQYKVYIFST